MPVYNLGNGNNAFDSAQTPGFTDGSTVNGENGNDSILAVGNGLGLSGGNGDDAVTATGLGNTLDGGRGADQLNSTSFGGFFQVGAGNVLIGGQGTDAFSLNNGSDLIVTNDTGSDGDVVSQGDVVAGVIDVVADYQAGELLLIGATSAVATVGLDGGAAGHQHLELGDGQYGIVRGDLTADGQFTVGSTGSDLLVVYDRADGFDDPFIQGAVALTDYTGSVLIG